MRAAPLALAAVLFACSNDPTPSAEDSSLSDLPQLQGYLDLVADGNTVQLTAHADEPLVILTETKGQTPTLTDGHWSRVFERPRSSPPASDPVPATYEAAIIQPGDTYQLPADLDFLDDTPTTVETCIEAVSPTQSQSRLPTGTEIQLGPREDTTTYLCGGPLTL